MRGSAALAASVLLLAACGSSEGVETSSERAEPVGSMRVSSIDNTFRPGSAMVPAGTEIVWTNDGRNDHNVLPTTTEGWGVGTESFAPGDEYRFVFTEPGSYPYYCSLHGTPEAGMIGTIEVSE